MNLEWLQNGALATGIAAIVTSVGVAGAGGLVSVREQSRRSTKKLIKTLEKQIEAADARTLDPVAIESVAHRKRVART